MIAELPEAFDRALFDADDLPAGFPSAFAIVTAWPPTDAVWTLEHIARQSARLWDAIAAAGWKAHPVTGWAFIDAEGGAVHSEPGWAVGCQRDQARRLGLQFQQQAVWWVDGDRLEMLACDVARYRDRVVDGRYASRRRRQPGAGSQ